MKYRHFFSILLSLFIALGLHAQELPEELQHLEESDVTRFGLEMEVIDPSLEHLVHIFDFGMYREYFDYDRFSDSFPDYDFDDYLKRNSNAFWQLPQDLQDELSEGLNVQKTQIHVATSLEDLEKSKPSFQPPQQSSSILDASGKPMIREAKEIILSEHQVHNRNWDIINERWIALGTAKQFQYIDWNMISRSLKAQLLRYYYEYANINNDAPKDIKSLLDSMRWSQDGSALEFRYLDRHVVRSIAQYYRDLMTMAKYLGPMAQLKIKDPEDLRVAGYSYGNYHLHLSSAEGMGPNMSIVGPLLNRWLMLKRINLGIISDLLRGQNYTYNKDIRSRGLLRVYDDSHFEVRMNSLPIDELLGFVVPITRMSTDEAVKTLTDEILTLLTEKNINRMIENNPAMLKEFQIPLGRESKAMKAANKLLDEMKMVNSEPEKYFHLIKYQEYVLSNFMEYRGAFLDSLYSTNARQFIGIKSFLEKILSSDDERLITRLLYQAKINKTKSFHSFLEPYIIQFLEQDALSVGVVAYLGGRNNWSKPIWKKVLELIQSSEYAEKFRYSSLFEAIYHVGEKSTYPKEFWDYLGQIVFQPNYIKDFPVEIRTWISHILHTRSIPFVFVQHLQKALSSSDNDVRENAQLIIRNSTMPNVLKAKILYAKACDLFFN